MAASDPLLPQEFSVLAAHLPERPAAMAVAVSGGGDSMALLLLLHEWCCAENIKLTALTVDHGLRTTSSAEAADVQTLCRDKGINHHILRWEGEKPSTHVQEEARRARYRLLTGTCRALRISILATAHNQEDVIETFWMRLAHGSGLDGLSAMAAARMTDGVLLWRPLLNVSRERLRATCRRFGAAWIDDPSNTDNKYLRARLRGFEDLLAAEGLTPDRLSQTLRKLSLARDALESVATTVFSQAVHIKPEGYALLSLTLWRQQPEDIQLRLLSKVLQSVAPADYPPGFEALEDLRHAIINDFFAGMTLHGCDLSLIKEDTLLVAREAAAVAPRQKLKALSLWDRRFYINGQIDVDIEVGGLGDAGLHILRKSAAGNDPVLRALENVPGKVRKTLPAFWQGDNLLAVPALNYSAPAAPKEVMALRVLFPASNS